MIPDAVLDQIQDRIDIVEVVSAFLPLRRAGKNFKACCPFHHEKTPSFIVNPDKQIFHCFGCGAGGNVFTFVMKFEKRDFLDVVETLANRVGIEIPKSGGADREAQDRQEIFYKLNSFAMDFYHEFLLSRVEAKAARAYLAARGVDEGTIRDFKIGYAPDAWETLYQYLKDKAAAPVLEKSGLFVEKKEGGCYDRFRRRVIFPIIDLKGRCVAFGGRVMDDSVPKYLNSPETEIYSKGRNLYALYQARQAVRENDRLIMVEGYMDVIASHKAGVRNVVASLGTALTVDQVRLVKRHTQNALILYDADAAGEMATVRGLEIFLMEEVDAKIARLPQGHDPDSFLKQFGSGPFLEELSRATSIFDFKLALLKKQYDPRSLEGRVKIANEMVTLFAKVKNEILKAAWTKELGQQLGLSEDALIAQMRKGKSAVDAKNAARFETNAEPRLAQQARPAERLLVGLCLHESEFAERVKTELVAEDFENTCARSAIERIFQSAAGTPISPAHLISDHASEPAMGSFISMAWEEAENTENRQKAFADCLLQMRRYRLKNRREWLLHHIEDAQASGNQGQIHQFMTDLNHLNKEEKINEKK